MPLPSGAIRAGVIIDIPAVSDALRRLWSQGKFRSRTVALGIASEGVLVRQMDLDWMPPSDFAKALRYQVADALPFPVDEANLDYHLLEELDVPAEQEGQTRHVARILLVAAARDVVDSFVQAVHGAGLKVVRADLLPFALIRASCPDRSPGGPLEAIIDIGADTVAVVIHQGGQPRSVRMIPGLGSDRITRALKERYEWSWEEAERTKVALGLPTPDSRETPASERVTAHPAQQVIVEQVAILAAEVRATLDFFLGADAKDTGRSESARLSRVVLAGSGSRLGGLAQVLAAHLGVPVELLSVLGALDKRRSMKLTEEQAAALVVPAGLWMGVSAP